MDKMNIRNSAVTEKPCSALQFGNSQGKFYMIAICSVISYKESHIIMLMVLLNSNYLCLCF